MTVEKVNVLIIGSGPAGYTAAIYAARAGLKPVLYQGMQPGGQLMITNDVENYPGYPKGIMGPEMMEDFKNQAERFGTDIRFGMVTAVSLHKNGVHKAVVDDEVELEAEAIIISTGASAKWLGLPAEERLNGNGVSACAVCDGFFFRNQEVAIVGAGDTACEEATYLSKLCSKVHMIVRKPEGQMRASRIMQHRVMNTPNIQIYWNSVTEDLVGEEVLEAVKVKNLADDTIQEVPVKGFFVAIGHKPNTDIFKGQLDMDESGYLQTVKGSTLTNVPGVFAAGDAQDNVYRQAVTSAGTGCMAALDAERYLAAKEVH
jgi:thioredoxin reductase (NADPH)